MIKEHVVLKGRNTETNERIAKNYTTNRNGRTIRKSELKNKQKFIHVEFYAKNGNHNLTIINDEEAKKFIKISENIRVIDYSDDDIKFRRYILDKSKKVTQLSHKISSKFNSFTVTKQLIDEIEYVISEVICNEKYSLICDDALGEDMSTEDGSQISICRNKDKTKILWKDVWEHFQENSSFVEIYTYFDTSMKTTIQTGMGIKEAIIRLLIIFC